MSAERTKGFPGKAMMRTHFAIPRELWDLDPADLRIPTRLKNVLHRAGIRRLGDLDGMPAKGFRGARNCGHKTLVALFQLAGCSAPDQSLLPAEPTRFVIAPQLLDLKPSELPIPTRLDNVLRKLGIQRLGDLHGMSVRDFGRTEGCGKETLKALRGVLDRASAGEFAAPAKAFAPGDLRSLLQRLDEVVLLLPKDARREMFLFRLGAQDNRLRVLSEVGGRFNITRERVRQIEELFVLRVRRQGGRKLARQVEGLARICIEKVCPLTPSLMKEWLTLQQGRRHPRFQLGFYARLLEKLDPAIPAWPRRQEPWTRPPGAIERAVAVLLNQRPSGAAFGEIFKRLRAQAAFAEMSAPEFLQALKRSKTVVVDFATPSRPRARLRPAVRAPLPAPARSVLEASERPLPIETLMKRAQARCGGRTVARSAESALTRLIPDKGFYLLGLRTIGLRGHIRLKPERWRSVRDAVHHWMDERGRPASTADMLECGFSWAKDTNRYELRYILGEDGRFVDLGRFLFGLRAWGLTKRDLLKDVILQVLAESGGTMTRPRIIEQVQRVRSASDCGVSTALRNLPQVCRVSRGLYRLRSSAQ